MKVSQNKFVSLTYELRKDNVNGNIIETVTEQNPLSFIFGSGHMLQAFEENIMNCEANDTFDFAIDAENAYGQFYDDAIANLPMDVFKHEGKIDNNIVCVDNVIPMQNEEGNVFYGKILEVNTDDVKIDFNHPLAGVNLHFKGKLIEVREATEEELNPKHKHDHDHSCGCGC